MAIYNLRIYGKEYKISSRYDESYVTEMAHFLESRMKELAEATMSVDFYRLLVMASMTVVDDYFKLMREYRKADQPQLASKLESIIGMIESSLTEKRVL
ncbi:MAG: cell division protein ZapA [Holophagae bacterium]|nr:cell division protein ZapA [Holophagae bacterium]